MVRSDGHAVRYFFIGPSGSGKTVVAARLAKQLGWPLIDTDEAVRRKTGRDSIAEVFAGLGETRFRQLEMEALKDIGIRDAPLLIATGGGLPASPGAMDQILDLGVPIYLRAKIDTLWRRLSMAPEGLASRPLLAQGGRDALESLVQNRIDVYMRASIIFDTDHLGLEGVISLVARGLDAN